MFALGFLLPLVLDFVRVSSTCSGALKRNSLTSTGVLLQSNDGHASLATWGAPINTSTSFTSLAHGYQCVCAIDTSGAMSCFGISCPTPPAGLSWSKVTVASTQACGITTAGSLRCWGTVLPNVPVGLTWKTISLTEKLACGIQSDGSLNCFGDATVAGIGATLAAAPPNLGRAPWLDVAVARTYVPCALDYLGAIVCWGGSPVISPSISSRSWTRITVGSGAAILPYCVFDAKQRSACFGDSGFGIPTPLQTVPLSDAPIIYNMILGVTLTGDVSQYTSCGAS